MGSSKSIAFVELTEQKYDDDTPIRKPLRPYLSTHNLVDLCFKEIVPEMGGKYHKILKEREPLIRSIFIENDIDSFNIQRIDIEAFEKLMGEPSDYRFPWVCGYVLESLQHKMQSMGYRYPSITWRHITNAIDHEMNHSIAQIVESLSENLGDLNSENPVTELITAINTVSKSNVTQSEAQYLRALIQRATGKKEITQYQPKSMDLHQKEPNRLKEMLHDVWKAHKVFMFGMLSDIDPKSRWWTLFENRLLKALMEEDAALSTRSCAEDIIHTEFENKITLHPSWLIHDDVFEVMKYHFAASEWVNRLMESDIGNELNVICCVIPQDVVSLYDYDIVYEQTLYVKSTNYLFYGEFEKRHHEVVDIFDRIMDAIDLKHVEALESVVLLFDRRQLYNGTESFAVFECASIESVPELLSNYLLALHFNVRRITGVQYASIDDEIDKNKFVSRSWLHYGNGNRIRFWPEQLVWFIPRLFVKNKKLSGYQMAERLYSNDYKHGFCVNLSDPVFDRFYKILTSWKHGGIYHDPLVITGIYDDDCSKSIATFLVPSEVADVFLNLALYYIDDKHSYIRETLLANQSALRSNSFNQELGKHMICLDVLLLTLSTINLQNPPQLPSSEWMLLSKRLNANEKSNSDAAFLSDDSRCMLQRKVQSHQCQFVDWQHVITAVTHEMNHAVAESVRSVTPLPGDLNRESANALISAIDSDAKRNLAASEAHYLRKLILRAVNMKHSQKDIMITS